MGQVGLAFRKVIGNITGIEISKAEIQRDSKPVKAVLPDYKKADVAAPQFKTRAEMGKKRSRACSVQ